MTIDEHRKNIALAVHNLNEAMGLAAADRLLVSVHTQVDVQALRGIERTMVYATLSLPCR
jgi:hypothetical protein